VYSGSITKSLAVLESEAGSASKPLRLATEAHPHCSNPMSANARLADRFFISLTLSLAVAGSAQGTDEILLPFDGVRDIAAAMAAETTEEQNPSVHLG
jgi:hypothetical protein